MDNVVTKFPGYIYSYVAGFVVGIISDLTLTSVFVTSALIGYGSQIWIGAAVFFALHVLISMVNAISGAIAVNGKDQAQATNTLANVIHVASKQIPDA